MGVRLSELRYAKFGKSSKSLQLLCKNQSYSDYKLRKCHYYKDHIVSLFHISAALGIC